LIITAEERIVKPGSAFKDIAFRALFEIVKFQSCLESCSHSLIAELKNNNSFVLLFS
jgi:hypothetical protein